MPKRDFVKETAKFLKEANQISKLVTGKSLRELAQNTVKILTPAAPADPDDPYNVLGIQPTASDRVVKFAFRAAAFDFHPDTGVRPDAAKFQKAVEAFEAIEKERKKTKES